MRYRGPEAREVQSRVSVVLAEELLVEREWPRGLYVFTTLDSMNSTQRAAAQELWSFLSARPEAYACLNDPGRCIGRYELLRRLHESGANDFNVHRLSDLGGVRFPAFVRYESLHRANLTGLVGSQDELEDAVARLLLRGERAEDLIVTEWLDCRSEDGYYRKWGAHICGDAILAKHVFVGTQWMLKMKHSKRRLVGTEEYEHVLANPHVDLLRSAFETSGCDWARIDYGFYKGRMQVWEVNDNPELGKKWKHDLGRRRAHAVFYRRFEKAIDDVTARLVEGPGYVWGLRGSADRR